MSFSLPRKLPSLRFTGGLRALGPSAKDAAEVDVDDDAETKIGKSLTTPPPAAAKINTLGQARRKTPLPSPAPAIRKKTVTSLPPPLPPPKQQHLPTRATIPAPGPVPGRLPNVIVAAEIPPPPMREERHHEEKVVIMAPQTTRRRDAIQTPEPMPWLGRGPQHSMSDAETQMIEREDIERERARLAADQRAAVRALPVPHFRGSHQPYRMEPTVATRPPPPPPRGLPYAAWILVAVIMGVVSFHVTPIAFMKLQRPHVQAQ